MSLITRSDSGALAFVSPEALEELAENGEPPGVPWPCNGVHYGTCPQCRSEEGQD